MIKALFPNIFAIFAICLSIVIVGCGEDEEKEEPAKIINTDPNNGGDMFANGSLVITFDKAVTEVKVNGIPADVDGTKATWNGQGLQVGEQTLTIKWTDENNNTGSSEITLKIMQADNTVCFRPGVMLSLSRQL